MLGKIRERFRRPDSEADDLDEWERHHYDPRAGAGESLFIGAMSDPEMSLADLNERWQAANRLVGKRAPADYGEFLAYGYLQGRIDAALADMRRVAVAARLAATPSLEGATATTDAQGYITSIEDSDA